MRSGSRGRSRTGTSTRKESATGRFREVPAGWSRQRSLGALLPRCRRRGSPLLIVTREALEVGESERPSASPPSGTKTSTARHTALAVQLVLVTRRDVAAGAAVFFASPCWGWRRRSPPREHGDGDGHDRARHHRPFGGRQAQPQDHGLRLRNVFVQATPRRSPRTVIGASLSPPAPARGPEPVAVVCAGARAADRRRVLQTITPWPAALTASAHDRESRVDTAPAALTSVFRRFAIAYSRPVVARASVYQSA